MDKFKTRKKSFKDLNKVRKQLTKSIGMTTTDTYMEMFESEDIDPGSIKIKRTLSCTKIKYTDSKGTVQRFKVRK